MSAKNPQRSVFRRAALFAVLVTLLFGGQVIGSAGASSLESPTSIVPTPTVVEEVPYNTETILPPAMEETQVRNPVLPGTVEQTNSIQNPSSLDGFVPLLIDGSTYITSYGVFRIDAPFIRVYNDEQTKIEATVVFTAIYKDSVLEARDGVLIDAGDSKSSFRYSLFFETSKVAVMKVSIDFLKSTNKITIELLESDLVQQLRVAAFVVTDYEVVLTMDPGREDSLFVRLPFYGILGLNVGPMRSIGNLRDAIVVQESRTKMRQVRLDFSDAKSADGQIFAQKRMSLLGLSGNVAAVVFGPGHSVIDPSLVATSASAALQYSTQKKTFYDGQRYWAFWYESGFRYAVSDDGITWSATRTDLPTTLSSGSSPGANTAAGFSVVNYGKLVAVVWTASTADLILMAFGEIAGNLIKWRQYIESKFSIAATASDVNAVFTGQGQLFIAAANGASAYGYRLMCDYTSFACSVNDGGSTVKIDTDIVLGTQETPSVVLPVALAGDSGGVAVFYVQSSGYFVYIEYIPPGGKGPIYCYGQPVATPIPWSIPVGGARNSMAAAAAGGNVFLILVDGGTAGSPFLIREYSPATDSLGYCKLIKSTSNGSWTTTPSYLSAGTVWDGLSVYFVFTVDNTVKMGRITAQDSFQVLYQDAPWNPASYMSPRNLIVPSRSIRFVPLLFWSCVDTCALSGIRFSLFYLPSDMTLGPRSPWSNAMASPYITEGTSQVSTATGLLTVVDTIASMGANQGAVSLNLIYREPSLFVLDANALLVPTGYISPPAAYGDFGYTALHLDLPWISDSTVLNLPGGQKFFIRWMEKRGNMWIFNNTEMTRFTLEYDTVTLRFTLRALDGSVSTFNSDGTISRLYFDPTDTANNYIDYQYSGGKLIAIEEQKRNVNWNVANKIRITYSGSRIATVTFDGKTVSYTYSDTGCSTQVCETDPLGKITKYSISSSSLLLGGISYSTGGVVSHTFGSDWFTSAIRQGPDFYSAPVIKIEAFNETLSWSRITTISYGVKNSNVVYARAKAFNSFGGTEGVTEYRFREGPSATSGEVVVRDIDRSKLILDYDMVTKNGGAVKDLSGNAHDGALTVPTVLAPAQFGQGRKFVNSTTTYVNSGMWKVKWGAFTLHVKFKISAWATGSPSAIGMIVSKFNTVPSGNTSGFRIYSSNLFGEVVVAQLWGAGTTAAGVEIPVVLDKFYAVTLVYDPSLPVNRVKVYLDGSLVAGTDPASPYKEVDMQGGLSFDEPNLAFGVSSDLTSQKFDGVIDEAKIYDRALSSDDIMSLQIHNDIQRRMVRHWNADIGYVSFAEVYNGFEVDTPSFVSQADVDDWGNTIYVKGPAGESLSSFANANSQERFKRSGELKRTTSGKLMDEAFDRYTHGFELVGGQTSNVIFDDSIFNGAPPSVKFTSPTSGQVVIERDFTSLAGVVVANMYVRFSAATNSGKLEVALVDSNGARRAGVTFDGTGTSGLVTTLSGLVCAWPSGVSAGPGSGLYTNDLWYRLTMYSDGTNYYVYLNGIRICSEGLLSGASSLVALRFTSIAAASGTFNFWVDDIRVASDAKIGVISGEPVAVYTAKGELIETNYDIEGLYFGRGTEMQQTRFPNTYISAANNCGGDNGDWTNPQNILLDDLSYATAAPGTDQVFCMQFAGFGFDFPQPLPSYSITSVVAETNYRVDSAQSGMFVNSELHVSIETVNGAKTCSFIEEKTEQTTLRIDTYDFTQCIKTWGPTDFNSDNIKVEVGAHQTGVQTTFTLDYVKLTVKYALGMYEMGDNFIRVFGDDGLLEFEAPFKDIYGGDLFTYTPPRITDDELVRTRSGFGYWDSSTDRNDRIIVDDEKLGESHSGTPCGDPASGSGGADAKFKWLTEPTVSGSFPGYSHTSDRAHQQSQATEWCFTGMPYATTLFSETASVNPVVIEVSTTQPFKIGGYYTIADTTNSEAVKVTSINTGVSIVVEAGLAYSHAAGTKVGSIFVPRAGQFLTQYVFFKSVYPPGTQAPQQVLLELWDSEQTGICPNWRGASWGTHAFRDNSGASNTHLLYAEMDAPLPSLRDEWFKLVVKVDDMLGEGGAPGSCAATPITNHIIAGVGYVVDGGSAIFDATALSASDSASITVRGIGSLDRLRVYMSNTVEQNQLIASATAASGIATVSLYPTFSVFPVDVIVELESYVTNRVYYRAHKLVWGGEDYTYIGASGFFERTGMGGEQFSPHTSIRDMMIGSKRPLEDCTDAVVCYDMESMFEDNTVIRGSGATSTKMIDLSGKGNTGTIYGVPLLSSVTDAASGNGLMFDRTDDYIQTSASLSSMGFSAGSKFTVSAWALPYDLLFNPSLYYDVVRATDDTFRIYAQTDNEVNGQGRFVFAMTFSDGTTTTIDSGVNTITEGKLYHVALTWDGTYLRGFVDGGNVVTSAALVGKSIRISGSLRVSWPSSTTWSGAIDQVILYNKLLSTNEIRGLRYSRLPGVTNSYTRPNSVYSGSWYPGQGLPDTIKQQLDGREHWTSFEYEIDGLLTRKTEGVGGNVTTYRYAYSLGKSGPAVEVRPKLSTETVAKYSVLSYDRAGRLLSTLGPDCKTVRLEYDLAGRVTKTTAYYDDSSIRLFLNMESVYVPASGADKYMDMSCNNDPETWNYVAGFTSAYQNQQVDGAQGMAVYFPGTSDVTMQIPDSGNLDVTRTTLAAWVKPVGTGQMRIISKWGDVTSEQAYLLEVLGGASPGKVRFSIRTSSSSLKLVDSSSSIPTGVWSHVAGVYDGTKIVVYINGLLASPSTAVTANIWNVPTHLRIGEEGDGSGLYRFTGTIDEVYVFDQAVDVYKVMRFKNALLSEINSAYDDMVPRDGVTSWTTNQFSSVTKYDGTISAGGTSMFRMLYTDMETKVQARTGFLEDLSGNGNHVKITGAPTVVPGVIGNAYQFTTSDAMNTIAANRISDKEMTAAAWVKVSDATATRSYVSTGVTVDATSCSAGDAGSWDLYSYGLSGNNIVSFAIQTSRSLPSCTWYVVSAPAGTFPLNQWTHIAATLDGVNQRIYVNGVLQSTLSRTVDSPPFPLKTDSMIRIMGSSVAGSGTAGLIDEVQVFPVALVASDIGNLYKGYAVRYPSVQSTVTDNCGSEQDTGEWLSPTLAFEKDSRLATATPPKNNIACNEFSGFGFDVPSGAKITAVRVDVAVKVSTTASIAHFHVSIQSTATNEAINCVVSEYTSEPTQLTVVSFDYSGCTSWKPSQFNSDFIKVEVGAHRGNSNTAVTFYLDYVAVTAEFTDANDVYYMSPDTTNAVRSYSDGLGRTVRVVHQSFYGKKISTVSTMGWNDQPLTTYLPSGQFVTHTYDYYGEEILTRVPRTPALGSYRPVAGETYTYDNQRKVEQIDGVGSITYAISDVLGRVVETGSWNSVNDTYDKVLVSYNLAGVVSYDVIHPSGAKHQGTTRTYYNSLGKSVFSIYPDGTTSFIVYDNILRPYWSIARDGTYMRTDYDALSRITTKTLKPSSSSTTSYVSTFTYDTVGNMLTADENGTVIITKTYDALYRLASETVGIISDGLFVFNEASSFSWDSAGRLKTIDYPGPTLCSGGVALRASYAYDSFGRTSAVSYGCGAGAVPIAKIGYDTFGRLSSVKYMKDGIASVLTKTLTYDEQDRVTRENVPQYLDLKYTYDDASRIVGVSDDMFTGTGGASDPKAVSYTYDSFGRLNIGKGPWALDTVRYLYNIAGDITSKCEYNQATGCSSDPSVIFTAYNYDSAGWNKLTSTSLNGVTDSFTYNVDGSITRRSTTTRQRDYTYDLSQRLTKIVNSIDNTNSFQYLYDSSGRRVQMDETISGTTVTTWFAFLNSKVLYEKIYGGVESQSRYVYLPWGELVLQARQDDLTSTTTEYHHISDMGRNVRYKVILDYELAPVTVHLKARYKPFGEQVIITESGLTRFKFAGAQLDKDTGLYYMGARYYDPILSRFLSKDPAGSGYDYAGNDPINFEDTNGLSRKARAGGGIGGRGVSGGQLPRAPFSYFFTMKAGVAQKLTKAMIAGIFAQYRFLQDSFPGIGKGGTMKIKWAGVTISVSTHPPGFWRSVANKILGLEVYGVYPPTSVFMARGAIGRIQKAVDGARFDWSILMLGGYRPGDNKINYNIEVTDVIGAGPRRELANVRLGLDFDMAQDVASGRITGTATLLFKITRYETGMEHMAAELGEYFSTIAYRVLHHELGHVVAHRTALISALQSGELTPLVTYHLRWGMEREIRQHSTQVFGYWGVDDVIPSGYR